MCHGHRNGLQAAWRGVEEATAVNLRYIFQPVPDVIPCCTRMAIGIGTVGRGDGVLSERTMVKKRMKLRPVDVETLFTIICRALRRRVVVAVDDRASQPLVGLV